MRRSRKKRFSCGRQTHHVTTAYVSASTPTCWHQRVSRQKQAWHCGNMDRKDKPVTLFGRTRVKVSCYDLSVSLKGLTVVIWQVGLYVFNLETFSQNVTTSPKCNDPNKIPFCNRLIKWMKSNSLKHQPAHCSHTRSQLFSKHFIRQFSLINVQTTERANNLFIYFWMSKSRSR